MKLCVRVNVLFLDTVRKKQEELKSELVKLTTNSVLRHSSVLKYKARYCCQDSAEEGREQEAAVTPSGAKICVMSRKVYSEVRDDLFHFHFFLGQRTEEEVNVCECAQE